MRWARTSTAARKLGVSRWTVWRMAKAGELKWRRVGGLVQVCMESVDAYLDRHSLSAPDAPESDTNGHAER